MFTGMPRSYISGQLLRRFSAAAIGAFGVAGVAFCGGRLDIRQPEGYVDEAGAFRLPDGAILFEPGGKCRGYDRAKYATPSPECPLNNPSVCIDWGRERSPSDYPVNGGCWTAPWSKLGGTCAANVLRSWPGPGMEGLAGPIVYCNPDAGGDAFCEAFWRQFVLGDAVVNGVWCGSGCKYPHAGPRPGWDAGYNPCAFPDTEPYSMCTVKTCGELTLPVVRDGGETCEPPCALP